MRQQLTRELLEQLMKELARGAPKRGTYPVYLVGGGTAVLMGWRRASIDVDLYSDRDIVFRDIQSIKERLDINVEFARPEDFVPPLKATADRHVFIATIASVSFYHYDPYAQILSKIVRGFERDVRDARDFVRSGMVEPERLQTLVAGISDAAYSGYPSLSRSGVELAVSGFLSSLA
jgi:hypothetical protein